MRQTRGHTVGKELVGIKTWASRSLNHYRPSLGTWVIQIDISWNGTPPIMTDQVGDITYTLKRPLKKHMDLGSLV